tara:strand:+ start:5648 stop:9148 length:3501 start_codon:yes stop_codon:yes gene_type:complete
MIRFLTLVFSAFSFHFSVSAMPLGMAPPNVLIFLMDDMGVGDCRAYNSSSKVEMPNLERMAEQGMRFTDAHAPAAVCAPTRYSVMTGNYPWRGRNENGTWLFNMPSQILPGQKTIGQLMSDAGYETAFLGKVHLGGKVFSKSTGKAKLNLIGGYKDFDFSRRVKDTPASLGFNYSYELPQGIQGSPYLAFENGILVGEESELREWKVGTYGSSVIEADGFGSPDWDSSQAGPVLTRKALGFLDQHFMENQKKGIRKPFFMHFCSQSCHVPHTPPDELAGEKVRGVTIDSHLDMLVEADHTLGMFLEKLQKNGELENTLIIFTSDNGGLSRGPVGQYKGDHNSNHGFRGSKAQVYEGGHRVPLIVRWGNGKNNSLVKAGSVSNSLVGLQDLYATLAELTVQPMDSNQGLDSESFLPVLLSQKITPRTPLLIQSNTGTFFGQQSKKALRENSWKLIVTKNHDPIELYDLDSDPMETKNRIEEDLMSERVERMHRNLKKIIKSARSTLPFRINRNKNPKHSKPVIHSMQVMNPRAELICKIKNRNHAKVQNWNQKFKIEGKSPVRIVLVPQSQGKWDISNYRYIGIPIQNWDAGVTTIEGRINNGNLTSWSHHAVGFAVAPSWENIALGFPFPMVEESYNGPPVFKQQLGRPDGHRLHWRRFFPNDILEITLDIRSSSGRVNALIKSPFLAWENKQIQKQRLEELPYLDDLGQVRSIEWPGKAKNLEEARKTMNQSFRQAKILAEQKKLSSFGGWIDGPKLEASGRFRTEKVKGKWWMVDPEGNLFFSVGPCLTGSRAETLAEPDRAKQNFFSYLPDNNDYLKWTGLRKVGGRQFVNFPALNYRRYFGEKWEEIVDRGTHDRLRAWGLNTLACWSDEKLQKDRKTPYVLMSSIWWQASGHRKFPSPFRPDFQSDIEENLKKLLWAKDDPYLLGIFIGNELEWPDRIGDKILSMPDDHPTKKWALAELKKRNQPTQPAQIKDLNELYLPFVETFFRKCKAAINEVLPSTLYLGCRTHRGPNVLGRGALGSVDVFSVNVYDSRVRSWQIPEGADIPILASEFHFGAVDRGVPSPGLSGSADQRQRALSFAHYLASALADPRFVGVHWFQWIDQSAAGRKDRENHQCGFIDVAGKEYSELVEVVTQATQNMYHARRKENRSTEQILFDLLDQ